MVGRHVHIMTVSASAVHVRVLYLPTAALCAYLLLPVCMLPLCVAALLGVIGQPAGRGIVGSRQLSTNVPSLEAADVLRAVTVGCACPECASASLAVSAVVAVCLPAASRVLLRAALSRCARFRRRLA